jgi:hypothetical protein
MNDSNLNDDLLFDRLVDGELSSAERRQLLASLDDRPDGWRRCALRFLESQCWTENLRQLAREPIEEDATDRTITLASPKRQRLEEATPSRDAARHGVSWAAIAAGLLIAFTLGLVSRSSLGPGDGPPLVVDIANPTGSVAQVVPPPTPLPDVSKVDEALTFFVRDETGQTRPLRVPLLDAGELDRRLGLQFQTGVPDEVRNRLQDRGFNVQSKRRYAPLWLEDGRPMFVPVEDTRIVPVRQNVY